MAYSNNFFVMAQMNAALQHGNGNILSDNDSDKLQPPVDDSAEHLRDVSSIEILSGDDDDDHDDNSNDGDANRHVQDAEQIRSIIGNIRDPKIKAILSGILEDPLDAGQHSIKKHYYENDGSKHAWTATDILCDGLLFAGFDSGRLQRNNLTRRAAWFKAFYGVEHTTAAPYFADLRREYPELIYKDLFMTMNWLCLYDTYPILSVRWGYCEEYVGKKVMSCAEKMAEVARKKIRFELEHYVEAGRTVDCANFMLQEMRLDPSNEWFDWKTHSCGVKYEFCLAIHEPRVVRVHGPFKASVHDITVFRGGDSNTPIEDRDKNALYFQLREGEKCIADSGYVGEPDKVIVTKAEHSKKFREFMARAKNRQETFHWRLKSFNILGQRFRHGKNTQHKLDLHKMAVEAVAGIVQYDYENGHPPFDV